MPAEGSQTTRKVTVAQPNGFCVVESKSSVLKVAQANIKSRPIYRQRCQHPSSNVNMSANLYKPCPTCKKMTLNTKFFVHDNGERRDFEHFMTKTPICGHCALKVGCVSLRDRSNTAKRVDRDNRISEAIELGPIAIILMLQSLKQGLEPSVNNANKSHWIGERLFQPNFDSLCEFAKENYYRVHPLQGGVAPAIRGMSGVLNRDEVSSFIKRLTPDIDSFADLDDTIDMKDYSIDHLFRDLHGRFLNGGKSNDIG